MDPPVISALMLIEYVKCARAGGDSSRPIAMQEGDVEESSLTIRSTAPTLLPSSIIIALQDPSHSDLALPNSLHHPRTRPLLAGSVVSAFWYCWRRSHHARLSSESHAAATDSDTRRRTGGRLFGAFAGTTTHWDRRSSPPDPPASTSVCVWQSECPELQLPRHDYYCSSLAAHQSFVARWRDNHNGHGTCCLETRR